MLTLFTMLVIGFSLVVAVILLVVYLGFFKNLNRSWVAVSSCIALLGTLSGLQLEHLAYLRFEHQPLDTLYYRFLLVLAPPSFYFFSHSILFNTGKYSPWALLHLTPLGIVFFVMPQIAVPLTFLLGSGYCLWLVQLIYALKADRKRFGMEFFFFGFFAVLAVLVLIFGFSLSYIDHAYFYYFYANGIGFSFILVTGALMAFPEMLNELSDRVTRSYAKSTLTQVSVSAQVNKLEQLMGEEKLYQNESLNLQTLAGALDLTGHQLSELINTEYGVNFSRYIRERRVDAAKVLLLGEPDSSVLAISLETGFKSQSNFYAAFKEITNQSPGQFRKSNNC